MGGQRGQIERVSDDRILVDGMIKARGRGSGMDLDQPAAWTVELAGRPGLAPAELHRVGLGARSGGEAGLGRRLVSDERLLDRFVRLCEIASPTGDERAIADDVGGGAARAWASR